MKTKTLSLLSAAFAFTAAQVSAAPVSAPATPQAQAGILPESLVTSYVEKFNANDEELYINHIPNAQAAEFLLANAPRFECPDKELEETFYFRWWTYRKHIKKTPEGFIITEFLPKVEWAGKYNGISCAAVYHYGEGRWLKNHEYLDAYTKYWLGGGGAVRSYSFPVAYAHYNDFLATGDDTLIKKFFPDLIKCYEAWEGDHFDKKHGLFWQIDDRDWGEMTIGGHGLRPLINSFMIADAEALAKIAKHLGNPEQQTRFEKKAAELNKKMQETLWDKEAQFFKVMNLWERHPTTGWKRGTPKAIPALTNVRELYGYAPWAFNLVGPEYAGAWKFLMNPKHFYAPYGPSFAEQSHPEFKISYQGHECQWNGPSWPMSTTLTMLGLANLLQTQEQNVISKKDYFNLLKVYTKSHHLKREDGSVVPWIDENLNPFTGDWIARTRLKTWKDGTWWKGKGGKERGKDYNHSEFNDLIITGLVGLRPSEGNVLTVCPLITDDVWEWFALDNVSYHGKTISILWDKTGKKYRKGNGFMVFVDGKKAASSEHIGELKIDIATSLPAQLGKIQWKKYEKNPLIGGGSFGTIVDGVVLKEGDGYNMYTVWRPKRSLAIHTSKDGFSWSDPEIILRPSKSAKWEPDLRGEIVLKKDGVYHMWYTGQENRLTMNIGYATSPDGRNWTRQSEQPVITPTQEWEKTMVMGPHVIWDEQEEIFKMWYSGGYSGAYGGVGNPNEPKSIGYATSKDGKTWEKHPNNPIFVPDASHHWEQDRVTACQVIKRKKDYLMFYIGFRDEELAQIGMARSPDGIRNWVRYDGNPIVSPTPDSWDASACYRPFVIQEKENNRWLLWYNGRNHHLERMGVAIYNGKEIDFDGKVKKEQ